jgi:Cell division protein CrgA
MPVSKRRKSNQPAYTPPPTAKPTSVKIGNPSWLAPLMVAMFILGLLWIVAFYLNGNAIPVMKDLNNMENVLVGFGFIGVGFFLATRWR